MAVSSPILWREDSSIATEGIENVILDLWHVLPEIFQFPAWGSIVIMVIAFVGLVGNSVVLWLLAFHIKRNPFSIYTLNLAGVDVLLLCSILVYFILIFCGYFDHTVAAFLEMGYTVAFFYCVDLSLLSVISTERCLSTLFPIWYACCRPKHMSSIVCAILWALPVLFYIIDYILCVGICGDFSCRPFFTLQSLWFSLLSPVLCMYSLILPLLMQCNPQRAQSPSLYILDLIMVLVFLICGMPFGIMDLMLRWHLGLIPLWLSLLLVSVNSTSHPFIYLFLGRFKLRKEKEPLRVILQRALGEQLEMDDEGGAHSATP